MVIGMNDNKVALFSIVFLSFTCILLAAVLLFARGCNPPSISRSALTGESQAENEDILVGGPEQLLLGDSGSGQFSVTSHKYRQLKNDNSKSALENSNQNQSGGGKDIIDKDELYNIQIAAVTQSLNKQWVIHVLLTYAQNRDFMAHILEKNNGSIQMKSQISSITEISESREIPIDVNIDIEECVIVILTYPELKEVDRWDPNQ
jgi:hypothetical protein